MTVQVHVIFCQTAQCKWMLAALANTTEPDFDYLEDKKFWNFLANISQKLPQCSISGLESQFLASRHNSLTRLQRAFLVHNKRPLLSVHDFLIIVHTVLFLISFLLDWLIGSEMAILAYFQYSCNNTTTTWIQISRQNRNGFFSNASRQIII